MSILKSVLGACALGACIIPSCVVIAQEADEPRNTEVKESIVITPNRVPTPESQLGSSLSVIDEDEIRRKAQPDVGDLLRSTPGVDVTRNGGIGGNTSVFLRGANSEHTLVLIDGVEANDPMSPSRSFNLGNVAADNIRRIEVLRGPQSTLYGSDAMGGVINIITKRGQGPLSFGGAFEAGSYETFLERVNVSGSEAWFDYAATLSRLDSQGLSAAAEKLGNSEDDGLQRTTFSTRLGFIPNDFFTGDFILRYIDSKNDIDNSGGVGGDDPNFKSDARQLFVRAQGEYSLFYDNWVQNVGLAYTDHERNTRNGTDSDHPVDRSASSFDSDLIKFDWQHDLYLENDQVLTLGFEYEEETGRSEFSSDGAFGPFVSNFDEKDARTTGVFAQAHLNPWHNLFTTFGVRFDDHDRFGSAVTYRAATTYTFEHSRTHLKASFGTGFKAPSLYQLYSSFGDRDLDPEENTAWDIGIEQPFMDDMINVGITYFQNDFEDLIAFDSGTNLFNNIAGAKTSGIELYASVTPLEGLVIDLNYTFLDTEDETTGDELLRRPRDSFSINTNYTFLNEQANVNLEVRYVGKRADNDFSTFPATRLDLKDYTLVNLAGSYSITENFRVFGRIDNLLDQDYEDAFGFGVTGFSVFAGIEATFP